MPTSLLMILQSPTLGPSEQGTTVREASAAIRNSTGIRTTANYYQKILANEDFIKGEFDTSFVTEHPELLNYSEKRHPSEIALALAAAIAAHAGW